MFICIFSNLTFFVGKSLAYKCISTTREVTIFQRANLKIHSNEAEMWKENNLLSPGLTVAQVPLRTSGQTPGFHSPSNYPDWWRPPRPGNFCRAFHWSIAQFCQGKDEDLSLTNKSPWETLTHSPLLFFNERPKILNRRKVYALVNASRIYRRVAINMLWCQFSLNLWLFLCRVLLKVAIWFEATPCKCSCCAR